jgi:tRNA nucleotidyltransferase/poly(A) polymerase
VVNKGGFQYEIAQYRSDGKYLDGRRPEKVTVVMDFEQDSARRDLTVNSMGIDKEGNIIDYFDGSKDIKNKVIRTVGNPEERFSEDYLRMMRTARFAGKLGFDIDPKTKSAIQKHKSQVVMLAPERIKDELFKMASSTGDVFARSLKILDEVGILDIILPEVTAMKTTKETPDHHPEAYEEGSGAVFDHVMAALKKNKIKDPVTNLAVLLHDVGKPKTYGFKDGKHTYHGHAEEAKDIIDNIAKRLRLSNKEKDSILFAALNHMKLFKGHTMKPSKIMKLVNDENWALLKAVSYCDDSCRTGLFDKSTFDSVIKDMEAISKKWGDKTVGKVTKIVDGNRVMKLTGLRPGKQVGEIINQVSDYVINNNVKSDKEIDKLIMRFYGEMK